MGGSTADTWGISGPEFLGLFILFAIVSIVVSIFLRLFMTRLWGRSSTVERLSPSELGMLTGDHNAVMAALAQLRAAGLITSQGPARPLDASDRQHLEPFAIAVLHATAHLQQRTIRAATAASASPLRELRANLTARFYLAGPSFRSALLLAALPIDLVLILGIARIVAGISNDKPVAILVVFVIILALVWLMFLPKPRMTAKGRQALRTARREMTYLNPHHRPALASYGAAHAGLSAALFGGAALWMLDPEFAQVSEANRFVNTSSSSGYSDSGSTGSSCSSSSSSSCGGGGGCGGGGCGG